MHASPQSVCLNRVVQVTMPSCPNIKRIVLGGLIFCLKFKQKRLKNKNSKMIKINLLNFKVSISNVCTLRYVRGMASLEGYFRSQLSRFSPV